MDEATKEQLDSIDRYGVQAIGKPYIIKHLHGERITQQQAIRAKCYECMGYYADGRVDCQSPRCPLYPYHPYNKHRFKIIWSDARIASSNLKGKRHKKVRAE